jgi:hypothetical protein
MARREVTTGEVRRMRELRLEGAKIATIAAELGVSVATVHRHTVGICSTRRRVLTAEEVADVVQFAAKGWGLHQLAQRFTVSPSVIRAVLSNAIRADDRERMERRKARDLHRVGTVALGARVDELEREVARLRAELARVTA